MTGRITGAEAMVVPDLLRARVAEAPDAVALRVGDAEALTYGGWDARSNSVARGLVEQGVRPGDRVGLLFGNDRWADYAVAYLAVHKAGAAAVPIGSRFSGAELGTVLSHAGVAAVVSPAELRALQAGRSTDPFQAPLAPDDLAEILYTSGTTGLPKGVACSHRNLMAHDLPADAAAAPAAGPVSFLHAFPIGTQAGQESLRVPLRIAGRVAIALPSFDPDELCALVARHRVARLQLVPAMAQLVVVSGAHLHHDVSSVRRVILSSAPAAPALFARLAAAFPSATVWNAYALTEAGAARTLMEWDPSRPTAVGRPVGATEIRIADDTGEPVGTGATGEILLRRRGTPPRSYYGDPVATAEAFAKGWVHTGDIGHLDVEGYLHLTDRKKDLIITGGSNVSSVEVENALFEHPAVVEAAVVGLPHPVLGEDVAAAVVVRSTTTERELQDVVRARLAEHKVPHRVVLVDRLPRNASGKVVKSEVRALIGAVAAAAVGGSPAAGTRAESVVASVWEAVLGVAHVGVDDDFFALGGHSLAAAQIAARLGDAFGVEVPVAAVFEHPTVGELASAVEEAASAEAAG
ncbi:MAG: non-ribosomal peptide synthetase [Actinomycetota bacterium]|nr:non-ribosomal peptide synthetase [Actinomycetota bacterium]